MDTIFYGLIYGCNYVGVVTYTEPASLIGGDSGGWSNPTSHTGSIAQEVGPRNSGPGRGG
ncbi:hypothetical protein PanWU01x14_196510 [Parasponia andersonii]|uniref:Uncharacterized protein n=1 Tax=Parasponia andersonii TaxID=3476 RepID=A0A2P5BZQ8_PARAD|nr:hypothetical protein PanWU01x14_196510 [Parasponia andersonii]